MKLQEPDIPKYTKIQVSQVLEISLLGWGNSVSLFGGTKLAPSHSCRMWVSMDGIGKSLSPGHNYVFGLRDFPMPSMETQTGREALWTSLAAKGGTFQALKRGTFQALKANLQSPTLKPKRQVLP